MKRLSGVWSFFGLKRARDGKRRRVVPNLPNDLVREIYARTNGGTQARMRVATRAVHPMPAPGPTVRFVRRHVTKLYKTLYNMNSALLSIMEFSLSTMPSNLIAAQNHAFDILQTYPAHPARAAQVVQDAWAQFVHRNPDPALQRISRANASVTDAERVKVLGPFILDFVRAANKAVASWKPRFTAMLDKALKALGRTRKNVNAYVSRAVQSSRRLSKWNRRPSITDERRLSAQARKQRRAQRRQQRGQPDWEPAPPVVAATTVTPPPWVTLRGSGRARTVANKARASAAHPAVAGWS